MKSWHQDYPLLECTARENRAGATLFFSPYVCPHFFFFSLNILQYLFFELSQKISLCWIRIQNKPMFIVYSWSYIIKFTTVHVYCDPLSRVLVSESKAFFSSKILNTSFCMSLFYYKSFFETSQNVFLIHQKIIFAYT